MQIINNIKELRLELKKHMGKTIGFVPTMGFLHAGHQSLIVRATLETDVVVTSIFVNPLQFGANEDFSTYPRDVQRDSQLCKESGTHYLFIPDYQDIIGDNLYSYVNIKNLDQHLCGSRRPGHFQGVCTIVSKLFNIVQPTHAYFGQKDIQQVKIIQKMVEDLNFPIDIIVCPTSRDDDGLALSSRNSYLNANERLVAKIVPDTLNYVKDQLQEGITESAQLIELASNKIAVVKEARIDYMQIVDSMNLQPVESINQECVLAMAIFIGKTRLIDNIALQG